MRRLFGALLFIIGTLIAIGLEANAWLHPDMTQRRLFVENWPWCVAAVVALIAGAAMNRKDR